MAASAKTTIENKTGIHARPASVFVQTASKFKSKVWIKAKGKRVDAKSILMIMSMGLTKGTEITIAADGPDEYEAVKTLKSLVDSRVGEEGYFVDLEEEEDDSVGIFSDHEIDKWTNEYMNRYDDLEYEFEQKSSLTSLDISILMFTAAFQTVRWALLGRDKFRFDNDKEPERYVDSARRSLKPYCPTLYEITDHKVPYDVTGCSPNLLNRPGLSGTNHRYKALGHDPIAGFIFGTMNIATSTITISDMSSGFPSYIVENGKIVEETTIKEIVGESLNILKEHPENIGAALIRQATHLGTDVFTKQGLPIPLVSTVSQKTAKYLTGEQIDVYSTARSAALAILVNKIAEMVHRMYFDPSKDDSRIYEARTRKVLLYSNVLSSLLNVGYVVTTKDFKRLDIGGILVTLWRILTDREKIRQLREQFINDMLKGHYQRELDESIRELERLGIEAY